MAPHRVRCKGLSGQGNGVKCQAAFLSKFAYVEDLMNPGPGHFGATREVCHERLAPRRLSLNGRLARDEKGMGEQTEDWSPTTRSNWWARTWKRYLHEQRLDGIETRTLHSVWLALLASHFRLATASSKEAWGSLVRSHLFPSGVPAQT